MGARGFSCEWAAASPDNLDAIEDNANLSWEVLYEEDVEFELDEMQDDSVAACHIKGDDTHSFSWRECQCCLYS